MRRYSADLLLALVISIFVVCPPRLQAQEAQTAVGAPATAKPSTGTPAADWGRARVLGGHVFSLPRFVASSFALSSVAVYAGVSSRMVPRFVSEPVLEGEASERIDLNTVTAAEGIDVSIRAYKMFAVLLNVYGNARVGTNTTTLLGSGAEFEAGADAGALVRLFRFARTQLAMRATGGYYGGQQAVIRRFYRSVRTLATQAVQDSLAGGTTLEIERAKFESALRRATGQLVTSVSGYRLATAISAAHAFGPYVGLQANVALSYDRGTDETNSTDLGTTGSVRLTGVSQVLEAQLGLALDIGGDADHHLPFDFVIEYVLLPTRVDRNAGLDSSLQRAVAQRIALDIFYVGHNDLQLGLTPYAILTQPHESGDNGQFSGPPRELGAAASMAYIW